MIDNQYYRYYYVCFKWSLPINFLNDYCNVMFIAINNGENLH